MIPVTKPFMPPREDFQQYLQGIWERRYLTNNGPLVQKLEQKLQEHLGVDQLLYLSNGTIALQISIKALGLLGEIITTPFSYVATTSSIVWEGCKPVFVDIDPDTLNINPDLIKDAITDKTSAILATHVFGNPCDIAEIQKIANRHNLKVIYDAAHCFGTKYKGKSVYNYGDISTASFHATKLFHTIEGGAVCTQDVQTYERMRRMRNFGHAGPGNFQGVGINGKNSEVHAAMGLCNLEYIVNILGRRKKQCMLYDELLEETSVRTIGIQEDTEWNYAYYPVIFKSESVLVHIKEELAKNEIFPKRYFYPSLDTLEYLDAKMTQISNDIAQRILCLPLYYDLEPKEQEKISAVVVKNLKINQRTI